MREALLKIVRCPRIAGGVRCGGEFEQTSPEKITCRLCKNSVDLVRGVPVFHSDKSREYYDGNYRVRSRIADLAEGAYSRERPLLAQWVKDFAIQGPTLDIGCGTAIFAEILPGFVGLDYSLEALISEGVEGFDLVCGNGEGLPFGDQSFETVFSINALEHIPEVDLAFQEIDRVLRPGGMAILQPAWHCTSYQTELLPIKAYRDLNLRQKVTKAAMPILVSKPWKAATRLPARVVRRIFARWPTHLRFRRLIPNFSQWIADSDAAASIDCHEGILFFESRGYEIISHRSSLKKITAGHDWVIARKPARQHQS